MWIAFSDSDLEALKRIVNHASVQGPEGYADADIVARRIEQYEADEARDQRFINGARELRFMGDGECEVDDEAVTSGSDEGAYVMAWVWVSNEDAGIEEQENDDGEI